jgi:hypothetical protein
MYAAARGNERGRRCAADHFTVVSSVTGSVGSQKRKKIFIGRFAVAPGPTRLHGKRYHHLAVGRAPWHRSTGSQGLKGEIYSGLMLNLVDQLPMMCH